MATIEQKIEALEFEREGYVTFDKTDRVADVDEQLAYWRSELKSRGADAPEEPLGPAAKKQAQAVDGVMTEEEAAALPPSDGEAASNALADAHSKDTPTGSENPIVTEEEVLSEDEGKVEDASNALAAEQASQTQPDPVEASITTEAQVVAETTFDENGAPVDNGTHDANGAPIAPARNASAEEWREFEKRLPAPLNVPENAGRDEIIAAYVDSIAPSGNATKETWVSYAREHGIDTEGKSRDEIRAAAVDAGWATADAPPTKATSKPKRTAADSAPRSTR